MQHDIQDTIYAAIEASLEAQLRAVRKLRKRTSPQNPKPRARMSQTEIVFDILRLEGSPLHVSDIIERAKSLHNIDLDRESLVSALTKKVKRNALFKRTEPNTFALLEE